MRITIGLITALTLISGTAQASPYAAAAATARIAAPGYATPGEPAPATPAPQPYEAQPVAAPQPYGEAAPQPYVQPVAQPYVQPVAQPYGPPPGPAPYQPPPEPQRRRGKGLMITGFVMFGATYLTTAFVGAAALDTSRDTYLGTADERARKVGTGLVIPVIGPLIAAPQIETATGTMAAIFSFIAQAGGLTLGIAGAVRYTRDGRRMQAAQAGLHLGKGVRLGAAPRLGGGSLNLTYRF